MSSAFKLPVDIANRGCQRLGALRILTTDFSEDSQQAAEMGACYDACRESELRRNLWSFATKRCILRPLDTTTVLYTPPAYAVGTTYSQGAIVLDTAGDWWQSKIGSNVGNALTAGSAYWAHYSGPDTAMPYDATIAYFAGEIVTSGGNTYLSLVSANEANTPPSAGNWLDVTGTTIALAILYPIGAGPSTDSATANVYKLPHGFLRRAPVAPRASVNTYLGAPHLAFRDDAVEENGYLVSSFVGPRMLRYVQDFVDVQDMDVMFCEGLSARMALETCDRITGSNADRQEQHAGYKMAMGEARTANAIEQGAVDIPEDEFISCRI